MDIRREEGKKSPLSESKGVNLSIQLSRKMWIYGYPSEKCGIHRRRQICTRSCTGEKETDRGLRNKKGEEGASRQTGRKNERRKSCRKYRERYREKERACERKKRG